MNGDDCAPSIHLDTRRFQDPPPSDFAMHFEVAEHLASGAIRSDATGRGRYDLISPEALRRVAVVYEKGASQKGDRNWEKGMPSSRLYSSALRHIFQALEGGTDEDHLAHAVWNLMALMHFGEGIPERPESR